jgi:hypothetical protein
MILFLSLQDKLDEHKITNSGLYVLLMAQCTMESADVYLKGSIVVLDPCKATRSILVHIH